MASRLDEEGRVVSVRLQAPNGKTYNVSLVDGDCTCADHWCRKVTCKHAKACVAAFSALQLS